ncbi:MAG: hypothetical protein ACRC7H_00645 [Plesiomonas shigelloides]
MQEVKRIGGAEPANSMYNIRRMDTIEELNALEEKLENTEERHVLVKICILTSLLIDAYYFLQNKSLA